MTSSYKTITMEKNELNKILTTFNTTVYMN